MINIAEGFYEIEDIAQYIKDHLAPHKRIIITANNNTLRSRIKTDVMIYFTKEGTIGPLLGFDKKVLPMMAPTYLTKMLT